MTSPLLVEKFIPGGYALATLSDPASPDHGKKVFLWNALPGETVLDYTVTKKKSSYLEALATSLEHPSPDRVAPRDPCFLSTSPWQILSYPAELATKSQLVVEMFREQGIALPTPEIITDHHDYFYRNKMEYSLYWDKTTEKISLAFHARGSHRKLPITSSSLERPEIFARALAIVADLNARHEPAYKYQSLLLRSSLDGTVSGGLLENGHPHPTFPLLSDPLLGRSYSYSPNGFFQINLPVYSLALAEIPRYLTTDRVLDLYSGVGTIGLSVASDRSLTLVESNPSAFAELEKNVASTKNTSAHPNIAPILANSKAPRPDITPILANSEDALDYIRPDTTVILDPPRAGCAPALIDRLLSVAPPTIIYLSCNPITQARDLAPLLEKYSLALVKSYNFFPRTPHIENLVVLEKM